MGGIVYLEGKFRVGEVRAWEMVGVRTSIGTCYISVHVVYPCGEIKQAIQYISLVGQGDFM